MTARKRKAGESFKAYRSNLVAEERAIKQHRVGRLFYDSYQKNDNERNIPLEYST